MANPIFDDPLLKDEFRGAALVNRISRRMILRDLDTTAREVQRERLRHGEALEAFSRALARHGVVPDVLIGPEPEPTAEERAALDRLAQLPVSAIETDEGRELLEAAGVVVSRAS